MRPADQGCLVAHHGLPLYVICRGLGFLVVKQSTCCAVLELTKRSYTSRSLNGLVCSILRFFLLVVFSLEV